MTDEDLPELLEIEYSFSVGGHNSLKLMDGRLFFFSEADSHLTEKNEYLTLVKVPENSTLKVFWDDLDQLAIWDWKRFMAKLRKHPQKNVIMMKNITNATTTIMK